MKKSDGLLLKLITLVLIAASLTACGTTTKRMNIDPAAAAREEARQKALYVQTQSKGQERVQRLAYPMLLNAAPICDEEIRPSLGVIPANKFAWPKDYQDAAVSEFGVGDQVSVGLIIESSPAYESGLKEDDILLEIAGKKVPKGKKGTEKTWKLIEKNTEVGVPVEVKVRRGSETLSYQLTPVAVCNTYAFLIGGSEVNAYADGHGIYITTGMLRFVQDDLELATVIGHELAHNAMEHSNTKTANFLLGSILDIAAAAYGYNTQNAFGNAASQAFSQDFEAEADYVGMYILAIGGYPIEGVADFWRRMGMENPDSIATKWISTHPGTAERYLALEKVADEIEFKRQNGLPLRPDLKE